MCLSAVACSTQKHYIVHTFPKYYVMIQLMKCVKMKTWTLFGQDFARTRSWFLVFQLSSGGLHIDIYLFARYKRNQRVPNEIYFKRSFGRTKSLQKI